jgi:Na+-driven multidrug efflux pump
MKQKLLRYHRIRKQYTSLAFPVLLLSFLNTATVACSTMFIAAKFSNILSNLTNISKVREWTKK